MCGICGAFDYGNASPADEEVLANMLQVIKHRGPDDMGMYYDRGVALGICRLSIIDLVGGKQPICNENGSIVLICNGEIYNYRELTESLRRKGHKFSTSCDVEVIAHLYEDYGENCLPELRGMFAFALWDKRRRRLFLARDRLGIKPLYYTKLGNLLIFASEIKSILQHPRVSRQVDLQALSDFISLRYVPAPETMFAGIRALAPGHMIVYDDKAMTTRQYWNLSFAGNHPNGQTEQAYVDQLEDLLEESVRIHLMSDVPFGAFLSGGVDSSTVVALMTHFVDRPIETFSVGFENVSTEYNELQYAQRVADCFHTEHHEVIVRPTDLMDQLERIVWYQDQPIADASSLGNYMVARMAGQRVKMVLTGEGGDELFAGYARYAGESIYPLFRRVPRRARELALAAIDYLPNLRRPKAALYALCQDDEAARFTNWFALFNRDRKSHLMSNAFKKELGDYSSDRVFACELRRTDATDALNRMLYIDTKFWLPDDLLARGDKLAMAASVEARVPLLDHKLVEFAATLPPHLKLKGLTRKYLLKRVSSKWLPAEIINRKKQGFPIPLAPWFGQEAREYVRDVLSPATLARRGLFDPDYVEKLIKENEEGYADHGKLLWGLLNVELWYRVFIDSPRPASSW